MIIIGRIIVWYGSSVGQHIALYRINHCINFNFTDFIYDAQFMLLYSPLQLIKYAHTEQISIVIDFRILVISDLVKTVL